VLDKGQELDWFGSSFIVFFASVSLIAIAGAIYLELKCPNPIVNLRLFRERNFLFCCILILGFYALLYASTFLLPNFMQEMLGYTATTAGMVFSPAGLCTMIEVPIVGCLLTRGYDPRKMVFFGLVVVASSYLLVELRFALEHRADKCNADTAALVAHQCIQAGGLRAFSLRKETKDDSADRNCDDAGSKYLHDAWKDDVALSDIEVERGHPPEHSERTSPLQAALSSSTSLAREYL
jgi:hypothetical protein